MKILHVLASNKYSGAENVVCQIINMFSNDQNVEMVYCSPDGPIRETLSKRNYKFYPLTKFTQKELKKVLKEFQPDIIHAHDFRASILAAKASRKKPIVSHLHNNALWLKKYGIKSFLYGMTCKRYQRIITVSDSIFNEFVFGSKYKDKLTVLGNPININEIQKKANEICINDKFDIVFCGRLTEAKNPFALIDIINEIKKEIVDLRVAIIGDGELKDLFIKKIQEKKLEKNIFLYGFQKNPYPIIKQCKVLLLPSKWEGFGLVAVEALTLGVPVVCSNVGGLPNIVNDTCGKICIEDKDYYDEIINLLLNSNYHQQKAKMAKERAQLLNNIQQYYKHILTIYLGIKYELS